MVKFRIIGVTWVLVFRVRTANVLGGGRCPTLAVSADSPGCRAAAARSVLLIRSLDDLSAPLHTRPAIDVDDARPLLVTGHSCSPRTSSSLLLPVKVLTR